MKRRALLAALALASCSNKADPEAAFSRADRRLEGSSWRLISLGDEPVRQLPAPARPPGLTFKAGFASWTAGCNTFDARYRVENERLILRPTGGRAIGGCEWAERPLRAALGAQPMPLTVDDRNLTLETPAGPLRLRRMRYSAPGPR